MGGYTDGTGPVHSRSGCYAGSTEFRKETSILWHCV